MHRNPRPHDLSKCEHINRPSFSFFNQIAKRFMLLLCFDRKIIFFLYPSSYSHFHTNLLRWSFNFNKKIHWNLSSRAFRNFFMYCDRILMFWNRYLCCIFAAIQKSKEINAKTSNIHNSWCCGKFNGVSHTYCKCR